MYSISQEESATTGSFVEDQEIGALPKKKMQPIVFFLSLLSPHYSESKYLTNSSSASASPFGNKIPKSTSPLPQLFF